MKIPEISAFTPAYNEEKNIADTVGSMAAVLKKVAQKWELLVVDDGSKDKTKTIVTHLVKKDPRIKLISHPTNKGYGVAIKTGLKHCQYQLITHMDSDGQFSFKQLQLMLAKIDQADLVLGFRKKRTDSLYRQILQKILWLADWILFGLNVKDVDCGFKLFKKKVVDKIGLLVTESAITETEFVVRAKKAGFRFAEVGLDHHPRLDGCQTGGKLKVITKAAVEGLKLFWILTFKKIN